ncbi:MAG: hypothetical protein COW89_05990 [Nitrospinae bacterium CG22_combo_CG10-13_8_21_14_all_47_10]|nr:MAG: hypothetical protein COW89_05990 [Nitrospinae bacterium CG22_combo_CG10-13_8_21_14_all_47_10]
MANAGARARLNDKRTRAAKIIWIEIFSGDEGRKMEPDLKFHGWDPLREPNPEASRMASTAQHVEGETWPINARLVINADVMIEPKAEAKTNASIGPVKFKCQNFLVTLLPTLRNASMIRKNRGASIFKK